MTPVTDSILGVSTHDFIQLSTFNLVAFTLLAGLAYFIWEYRDGRAIGTKKRPDLFAPYGQQRFLLGDVIGMIKNQDRAMERKYSSSIYPQCACEKVELTVYDNRSFPISRIVRRNRIHGSEEYQTQRVGQRESTQLHCALGTSNDRNLLPSCEFTR